MRFNFLKQFVSLLIVLQMAFAPAGIIFAEGEDDMMSGGNDPSMNIPGSMNNNGLFLGQELNTNSGSSKDIAQAFSGLGALVGCKNTSARALGGAFGSFGGLFAKKLAKSDKAKEVGKKALDAVGLGAIATSDGAGSQVVPVHDETTDDIKAKTSELEKLATADNIRNECLNGLAYRLSKVALAQLTKQTVSWINSGFNGDSFFIKDQASYLYSLENEEINSILGPISAFANRKDYPYGRDYARAFLENRKSDYNNYSRSNLSSYLNKNITASQYSRNFMSGGWDGWIAMTQNASNNPLGFGMITSQQIADNAARSNQRMLNELNWGDGFLSQKKCVDPTNYTPKNAKKNPCRQWETVTPGITIANQLSNVMGTSFRQLEMADQINESLSIVFDALVNEGMSWGISKLSTRKDSSFETFGGPGSNKIYDRFGNDITNRSSKQYNGLGVEIQAPNAGGWFESETPFDITSKMGGSNTLDQVILTQQLYGRQLNESILPLPKIVPQIAELDYCVPGPNPNWENRVIDILNQQDVLYAKGIDIMDINQDIGNGYAVGSAVGNGLIVAGTIVGAATSWTGVGLVVGAAIAGIGVIVNVASKMMGGNKQNIADANQQIVGGIRDAEINLQNNLINETQYIDRKNFEEYRKAIDKYYSVNIPVASKAEDLTAGIDEYQDIISETISEYSDTIKETNSNITQLREIQTKVNSILDQDYIKKQIAGWTYCAAPNRGNFDFELKDVIDVGVGVGTGTGLGTGFTDSGTNGDIEGGATRSYYVNKTLSFESDIPMTDFTQLVTMQNNYKDTSRDYVVIASGVGNTLDMAKTRALANGKKMLENKKQGDATSTIKLLSSYSTKDNDSVYHYWGAYSMVK